MSQKSGQGNSQARLIVIGVALLLTLGMGIGQAIRNRQFLVMSGAYFVCGR